ncbi:MAG: LLM class F420-dependent oxidoreductase [Acidimicrobiales bacterium]|nr:LLM class F420-dependent oxidoreductase [Acidimicrobiales bacterium]MCB9392556.1 LLM class F420-dependent oxidoreductase [Acidimicrobiaceae bacterium]
MTKPSVDLGRVGIWYGSIDALPTPEAQRAAQLVEELGFGSLWVAEAVGRDPFVSSAVLLSATTNLKLATGIANIYARDPMTMVAGQKTLAEAFPGRFLLGMGVSHGHLVAGVRKHDYSKPYSYMVEYLDKMDKALFMAKGPADDGGRLLAALGPKMLELSATRANGAHPYFTTPEHTAIAREALGADALLAPEQMCVLETDPVEARRIARAGMKIYLGLPNYWNNLKRLGFTDDDREDGGSDRLVDAVVVWGTEEQIAERVAEHHAAGADHVCVQVLQDGAAMPEAQWRRLAPALLG